MIIKYFLNNKMKFFEKILTVSELISILIICLKFNKNAWRKNEKKFQKKQP